MVIGFLGKGGSGKSTLAAMLVRELLAQGKKVLAIDADHNMDLAYSLAGRELPSPYLGDAFWPMRTLFGLAPEESFSAVAQRSSAHTFEVFPPDSFTSAYTHRLSPALSVMLTGPHPAEVVHGARCSHSLASALKLYLPHLSLKENEHVVVDEKASIDAVTTGIPTGFDLAVIVSEPHAQSVRVSAQIEEGLALYGIPHVHVLNKVTEHTNIENSTRYHLHVPLGAAEGIAELLMQYAYAKSTPNISRKERSYKKFSGAQA